MRTLLILATLFAVNAFIHCAKSEKKEEFVIVVKDNEENTTTTEKSAKTSIKNLLSRYKNKRYEPKKKLINTENKNMTDPKVMYKFEVKDGRMKFQRDVDDSKAPESQTEAYEPIEYEPVQTKPTEQPEYTYQQYQHQQQQSQPIMYYKLCPVYYDPQQSPIYKTYPTNAYRSAKQLIYYTPTSDSFTRHPSNYESELAQNYQTYNNIPNYGQQIYDAQHYSRLNPPVYNNQYNLNGIIPVQSGYDPYTNSYQNYNNNNNYDNSQYYSNPYNDYLNQNENIYSNTATQQNSFVNPSTGSYQFNVGNKYTDTSNQYATTNKDIYQNTATQVPTSSEHTGSVNINYSPLQQNQLNSNTGVNYVYSKGNGKEIYYSHNSNTQPKYESVKISVNGVQVQ